MTCLYYNDTIQERHHTSGQQAPTTAFAPAASMPVAPEPAAPKHALDIVALARGVGMLITLDGCIGNAQYQSVFGSLTSLERFAQAVRESVAA
ncbi:MAG TPA: hypothetical protein VKS80_13085 [Trinickia sp.]|nr:hypothetical protein [Trinickia sp.]